MSNASQPIRIGPQPAPPPIPKTPPPLPKPPPPRIAKPEVPPMAAQSSALAQRPRSGVVAKARKLTHWELLFRIAIVVGMLASIAFPWWTYSERLIPLQKQSRDLTSANSVLSAEVDKMDRKWSKDDAEFIRAKYKEVYASLFADQAALQEWLDRLQKRALPLALDVHVDIGKGSPQLGDEKLAIVPAAVTLQVHPMPNGKDSPYQRLLRLGQQLATEGKRADLAELTVNGGNASITNALLVFNLWAGDEKKMQAAK